jgi:hypothetical protein
MPSRRDVCTGPIFSWEYLRHWRRSASLEAIRRASNCCTLRQNATLGCIAAQSINQRLKVYSGVPSAALLRRSRIFQNGTASLALQASASWAVLPAAYLDLIIRSCPRGLQGTTLMVSGGLFFIASRFGDVLGTNLYAHYGGLLFV